MITFDVLYDIGQSVTSSAGVGIVKSITIGSDKLPYYMVEFATEQDGKITYSSATISERGLSTPDET
jgi:hypothetical protein